MSRSRASCDRVPGCRCYLTGAYCIAPVVERSCNAYHMQLLSGCPPIMYWLGHYVWDMLCHTVVTVLAMAVFGVYVSLTAHVLCAVRFGQPSGMH